MTRRARQPGGERDRHDLCDEAPELRVKDQERIVWRLVDESSAHLGQLDSPLPFGVSDTGPHAERTTRDQRQTRLIPQEPSYHTLPCV